MLLCVLALAGLSSLVACGGDERSPGLPSVQVRELDGPPVDLASLSPREKPVLVWIWGPF